ncbi:MAG: aminotransferase class I/II-fold pyridoxal phosphate-dependent enzyme [[Clostridium] innocuum]
MNDEIWSDILYPDAQFNSIYCLGEERCKRVLSVFGFSKSFGLAGLRIGCVYASDDEKFRSWLMLPMCCLLRVVLPHYRRLPRLRLWKNARMACGI